MKYRYRYALSLLPLGLTWAIILLAEWAYAAFDCAARGKEFLRCYAYGFEITPLLGIGLFWCKLLLPVMWFISVPWFVYVACQQIEEWWKRRSNPTSGNP